MNEKLYIALSKSAWIRWLLILCIAGFALTIAGCTQLTTPSKAEIPASLTQPCPSLTPLEGKTGADVVRKLVEVGKAYNECADSKQALINAVR